MAYSGFLLKVGDYEIDAERFIKQGTYSPYVNMQALDPYTDANGYEHIDAVELKAVKVEFETPAQLTSDEFAELMSGIRKNYIEEDGRKCIITAYIPEYDTYVTQTAYLTDFKPVVYAEIDDILYYNPIRMAFVGGVADD
jgi:hypothetical protein